MRRPDTIKIERHPDHAAKVAVADGVPFGLVLHSVVRRWVHTTWGWKLQRSYRTRVRVTSIGWRGWVDVEPGADLTSPDWWEEHTAVPWRPYAPFEVREYVIPPLKTYEKTPTPTDERGRPYWMGPMLAITTREST